MLVACHIIFTKILNSCNTKILDGDCYTFLVELQKGKLEKRLGKKSVTSRPSVCSLSTYNFETDQVVNGV